MKEMAIDLGSVESGAALDVAAGRVLGVAGATLDGAAGRVLGATGAALDGVASRMLGSTSDVEGMSIEIKEGRLTVSTD